GTLHVLLPNTARDYTEQPLCAAAPYPGDHYPALSRHPCAVNVRYLDELGQTERAIDANNIYRTGVVRADLHWDKTTLPLQQEAFRAQAKWAKETGLPVSIHCRDAFDELFTLLDEVQDGRLTGVLHCFTGTMEQAQRAIGFGLHLGI